MAQPLTTVDFIRVILAVRPTITKLGIWDTLFTLLACKQAWATALHRHFPASRGGHGQAARGHQLICKDVRKGSFIINTKYELGSLVL